MLQQNKPSSFSKKIQQLFKAASLVCVMIYGSQALADAPPPRKPAKTKVIKKKVVQKSKKAAQKGKTVKLATVRLEPQIRSTELEPEVLSLNPSFLKQLRAQFKLIDVQNNQIQLPRIIAGDEGKRIFAKNDYVYAQNVNSLSASSHKNWQIIKVEAPIYDLRPQPETSNIKLGAKPKVVAYRALYRGDAAFVDQPKAELSRFLLTNSPKESDIGDYLIPSFDLSNVRLTPYQNELSAHILSLESIDQTPTLGTVALINKGSVNGLQVGHQLEIYSAPAKADRLISEIEAATTKMPGAQTFANAINPNNPNATHKVDLPQIKKSNAIVFDTTEQVSYIYIPYNERLIKDTDVITNVKP